MDSSSCIVDNGRGPDSRARTRCAPGGRSGPAPRHLASLVVADAFAGELTRGSFKTIPATEETTNTQRFEEDSWLGDLDSNQD
jgi:hypothetical protein